MSYTSINTSQIKNLAVTIAKLATDVTLNAINAPVADVSFGGFKATGVGGPVASTDATNKSYVDNAIQAALEGLVVKGSVSAATTTILPGYNYNNGASGVGATITGAGNGALPAQDGVTLTVNDILLVKNEVGGSEPYNGSYSVQQVGDAGTPFILVRAANFNSASNVVPNSLWYISGGTTQGDTSWILNLDGPAVIGNTNLIITQYSGTGQITAGPGLSKAGNVLSANVDNLSTEIISDNIVVKLASGAPITATAGLDIDVDGTTISKSGGVLAVPIYGIGQSQIANGNVSLNKIQNATANSLLLGSGATGSGASYSEIILGGGLSMTGTTLTASGSGLTESNQETPTGNMDGTNATFTLAHTPVGNINLFLNGLSQTLSVDFTIVTNTITMLNIPASTDVLRASYVY